MAFLQASCYLSAELCKNAKKERMRTQAIAFLAYHQGIICRRCSFRSKRISMRHNFLWKMCMKSSVSTEEYRETIESTSHFSARDSPETVFDVGVIGCGPAGLALATALSERKLRVVCVDPQTYKPWKNNYGVWLDQMESLNLSDCLYPVWSKTRVHIDNSRSRLLPFAYGRVDRVKMKQKLLNICKNNGVIFYEDSVENITQEQSQYSCITASQKEKLFCRLVVDATGHSKGFVEFHTPHEPGFQVAYGIEAEVAQHPFPIDEMLLMDFRDCHMTGNMEDKSQSSMFPTFLYAMPMNSTKIFLEETSLISKPPLSFEHLKQRLLKRLEFLQIEVKSVLEEEFCLIPMGGSLPVLGQNVLGFGGSAGMVHPATGYMFSRVMEMAPFLAKKIENSLSHGENLSLTVSLWNELWSCERILQRNFFQFGGEYLSKISLNEMRDFFWAFFMLPDKEWKDFLDFRLTSSRERLLFGLHLFWRTNAALKFSLMKEAMLSGRLKLLKSVVL